MAAAAILDFGNFKFLMVGTDKSVKLHHRAKFRQNRSNRCWDITICQFFQDGGRPPSWICNACVATTHEGHLVVFITVQNLVGIDAVVLKICTFFDFASLAWKRLFTPQNWGFLGGKWEKGGAILTPNELVLTFGGLHVCVQFGKNRRRNATVRVSTDGQTHTHTHTQAHTHRRKTILLSVPCYML